MSLASKVKERREELHLTQDQLAKMMGYSSRSSINKIEKGRPVSQKVIVNLAKALNTSPAYLMGWYDGDASLSDEEHLLLELFNKLNTTQKEAVFNMINAFIQG